MAHKRHQTLIRPEVRNGSFASFCPVYRPIYFTIPDRDYHNGTRATNGSPPCERGPPTTATSTNSGSSASRAKGTPRPDSDIDIALALMPPDGKYNWALAAYAESFEEWKSELRAAVVWNNQPRNDRAEI
jgi:hypothetical protein